MGINTILLCLALWAFAMVSFAEEPPSSSVKEIPGWDIVFGDFEVPENTQPGEVLSVIPSRKILTLKRTNSPYDPFVVGVAVLDSLDTLRVAIGGEVDVLIDPSMGHISAGEWLVTSGATGKAMSLYEDYPLNPRVIGIALEDYDPDSGKDRIRTVLLPGEQITSPRNIRGK